MEQEAPWKCDGPGCDRIKGPTNRWWMLKVNVDYSGDRNFVTIYPWRNRLAKTTKHYCSESCVVKAISNWMGQDVTVVKDVTVSEVVE